MAKGKSDFFDWTCTECNRQHSTSTYNKRNRETIAKELPKFCKTERRRTIHKRKDSSSGSKGNKR